jgi:hypothetical protein
LISSKSDFGRFALAMAVLGLSVGLVRSAVLEWELLDAGKETVPGLLFRRSLQISGGISIVGMGLLTVIGALPFGMAALFVIAAAASTGCDVYRFSAFARGRAIDACIIDAVWLIVMLAGAAMAHLTNRLSILVLIALYGVGGGVAVFVGYRRTPYDHAQGAASRRSFRSALFGADFALNIASGHAVTFLLAGVFGLGTLGAYRALLTLFQPFTTLAYALRLWQLRYLDWTVARGRTAAIACFSFIVGGLLYSTPLVAAYMAGVFGGIDSLGGIGIGVLIVAGASEVVRTVSQVGFDLARSMDRLRVVVANRSVQLLVLLIGSVSLTYRYGIGGAMAARIGAYGLAMVSAVYALWRINAKV